MTYLKRGYCSSIAISGLNNSPAFTIQLMLTITMII